MMPEGKKCCCCTLMTACLILDWLIFIGELFSIFKTAMNIMEGTFDDIADKNIVKLAKKSYVKAEQNNRFILATRIALVIELNVSFVFLVVSFVIIRAKKHSSTDFLPMLVAIPISAFISYIFIGVHTINIGFSHSLTVATNVVCCITTNMIKFCIWLCFFMHWQEIRADEKLDDVQITQIQPRVTGSRSIIHVKPSPNEYGN